jgi:class 3 adenylate cyclase/tetratricopeptide (TPR) repeat protein
MASFPDPYQCKVCGAPYQSGQRYCGSCGSSLITICPNCSTENPIHHHFCSSCGSLLNQNPQLDRSTDEKLKEPLFSDERRWVSVLFVDIAGFTKLSEELDPEEVMEFAAQFADQISEVVRRYGGKVLRVIGDEVFAVFGAPTAHEDDAERAVRAALEMRELQITDSLNRKVTLHVGINTGDAMFGQIGPQDVRDFTVMGDMVNTAARLRSAAPPSHIFVGSETYRSTQQTIHYVPVFPIQAKGKENPISAYKAIEARAAPSLRPLRSAPLVGRSGELTRLLNMYNMVVEKQQPHLVTIIGDPGIGKSRLAAEFDAQLPATTHKIHGRCLPYGESLGYGAIAMALKEAASIQAFDDTVTSRKKLSELVHRTVVDPIQVSHMDRSLALLIGLDLEQDHEGDPIDQRIQHAALRQFLELYARQQPVCMFIDDLHWADEPLFDLLEYVAQRVRESSLLIITQARQELLEKRPSWGRGVRSFTSLLLSPLDQDSERNLILKLLEERNLPTGLVEQVGSSSGGNPLFAEELVAMIAESGVNDGIPSMIKLLIAARLDALPPNERNLIQLASVFGKIFWKGGLQALGTGREVVNLLDSLEQKDLLHILQKAQFKDGMEYAFKHDLIRDVAYEMIPRARRRRLHGQAADWIETATAEQAEAYLDQLAHHSLQAGQIERALDFLDRAAERAWRVWAFRLAAAFYSKSIDIAQELGRMNLATTRMEQRAKAYLNVGMWMEARQDLLKLTELVPSDQIEHHASIHLNLAECSIGLMNTNEMRHHSERALKQAKQAGRDDLAGAALSNLSVAASSVGNLKSSVDIYQQALLLTKGQPTGPTSSHAFQVITNYWMGSFDKAVFHGELVKQHLHGDVVAKLELHGNLGVALTGLGRYTEAQQLFDEGIQLGKDYEVLPYAARTISLSAGYHLDLYDYAGHESLSLEARELSSQIKFMSTLVSSSIDLLYNYARKREVGKAEQLLPDVRKAMEGASGFHAWLWSLRFSQAIAEIALARGRYEEALSASQKAAKQGHKHNRPKYIALALLTQAKALKALGKDQEAKSKLRKAFEVSQGIKDPALLFRIGWELLQQEEDEKTALLTLDAVKNILQSLPEGELRFNFQENEMVRSLLKLTT